MEKLINERRGSTRINFASQPTIMLANAEHGSFSATLVDLCADGMCLNTDAPFLPGTVVKAYFPDHRGPTIKARVVRNWYGGLALIVSGHATRRLRGFINRLMHHDQQLKPIILKRSATSDKHATMGIAIITAGFIAALLGLLLIDSQAGAGLAGLIAMGAALTGGALLNQTKLDGGTARRAVMLGTAVALLGLTFRNPASNNSNALAGPWLTALIIIGLYMVTCPLEAYLNSKKRPNTHD